MALPWQPGMKRWPPYHCSVPGSFDEVAPKHSMVFGSQDAKILRGNEVSIDQDEKNFGRCDSTHFQSAKIAMADGCEEYRAASPSSELKLHTERQALYLAVMYVHSHEELSSTGTESPFNAANVLLYQSSMLDLGMGPVL
ncbi:hypothetical protein RRG08_060886 [Elysia crispata]|uniref:Uncharacterized protein n=1 Tax=Elysia crispata TaxID=231223 RepID=A0AAE1DG16_9GAST|nr:hypothetical protein RRG08_060886 [Elysia crispata]